MGGEGVGGKETGYNPMASRFYLLLRIFPSVMTGGVFLVGGGGGDRHYRSQVISPLRPCHKEMSNTRPVFA